MLSIIIKSSLLIILSKNKDVNKAKYILETFIDIDLNIQNNNFDTALSIAIKNKDNKMIDLLIKK